MQPNDLKPQPSPTPPVVNAAPGRVSAPLAAPIVDRSFSAPATAPQGESLESAPVPLQMQPITAAPSSGQTQPFSSPFAQFMGAAQTAAPAAAGAPVKIPRKAMGLETRISLAVVAVIVLITGFTFISQRGATNDSSTSGAEVTNSVPEQDLSVTLPVEEADSLQLQGSADALVVNGDVVSRGAVKLYAGEHFSNVVQGSVSADRTYTLPDASGTVCLDVNNCNFADADDLTALQAQVGVDISAAQLVAGTGISIASQTITNNGVLTLNGQSGAVSLTAGSGITIAGTTITNDGVRGLQGAGNIVITNLGNGVYEINDVGAGAQTVTLGPSSFQTDSTNNAAINITKTGSGNLLQLGTGATPTQRFVVDQTGAITTGSIAFGQLTGVPSIVNTLTGTANQVSVSGSSGNVTLSLPQNIATTSSPTFAGLTVSGNINGQTISSAASFTGTVDVASNTTVGGTLAVNTITPSGTMTIGATGQAVTLQGGDTVITETNAGNTTTLAFGTPVANVTYRLLGASAGTYDICTTTGNCAGVGGGVTTAGGTVNTLAKFSSSQGIVDSSITDNGTTVTIGAILNVATITPSGALTIGSTSQALTLQGNGSTALSATDSGNTNSLVFATPSGGNHSITIPNASGTLCLTSGNCAGVGGVGDILQGGNTFGTTLTLGTNDNNGFNLETNNTAVATLSSTGQAVFKNASNSTTAFQIQNAASQSLFTVDTTNNLISLNNNISGEVNAWQTNSPALPATLHGHAAVTANGYVYVLGGNNGSTYQSAVYYAKLNADGTVGSWTTNSNSLPAVRWELTAVAAQGYIYAIGGTTNGTTGSAQSTVYYAKLNADGSTGAWSTNANALPATRTSHASVTANGYLYVVGGAGPVATVYYAKLNADGSTGAWSTNANALPAARDGLSAVVANGFIYALSGHNSTAQTTVYYARLNADGSTDAWSTNANALPAGRAFASASSANGYVYMFGGNTSSGGNTGQSSVYYARINSDGSLATWSTSGNALPSAISYQDGIAANGYFYILGGTNSSNVAQSTIYYASTTRVKIGGVLDLVGLNNGNLAEGNAMGGSIVAGDGDFLGRLSVRDQALFARGIAVTSTLGVLGDLAVTNASGTSVLSTDSTNLKTSTNATKPAELAPWSTNSVSIPANRLSAASVTVNGYIYIIGGYNGSSAQSTVYYGRVAVDGSVASWTTNANALPATRNGAAAVYANGYIYVLGGEGASTVYYARVNSDGSLGTWSTNANALPGVRAFHTSIVANGHIYAIGGIDASTTQSTVYYAKLNSDGSTGSWSTNTNALPAVRMSHSSVVSNGYVYVIGGYNGATTQSTVYYARLNADGSIGSWSTNANALPNILQAHSSVVSNGYVYVIGGQLSSTQTAVYYAKLNSDGSTGSWTTNGNSLPAARMQQSSVIVNGYIYAIGGTASSTPTSTVYYTSVARLSVGGSLDLTTLNGAGGGDLMAGGITASGASTFTNEVKISVTVDTANLFQASNAAGQTLMNVDSGYGGSISLLGNSPEIAPWKTTNVFSALNYEGGGVTTANGYLYNLGGNSGGNPVTTVSYSRVKTDGTLDTWSNTTAMPAAREGVATVVVNGYIYAIGGFNTSSPSNGQSTVYYAKLNKDGTVGSWQTASNALPAARSYARAIAANGYIYVIGGQNTSSADQTTVYYAKVSADGSVGSWTTNANALPAARSQSGVAVVNGYMYVVGGWFSTDTSVYYGRLNASTGAIAAWSTSSNTSPSGVSAVMAANGYLYGINNSTNCTAIYYSKLNADGSNGAWSTSSNSFTSPVGCDGETPGVAINGYWYVIGSPSSTTTTYYTSLSRLRVGGSLDLVGAANGNLAEGGPTLGGNITAASGDFLGSLSVRENVVVGDGLTVNNAAVFNGDISVNNSGETSSWQSTTVLPAAREDATSVTANGYVYFIGGGNSGAQTTVYYAKLNADGSVGSWSTNANALPAARMSHTAVAANGYLYVIGGQTSESTIYYAKLNADGSTGAWSTNANALPAGKHSHSSVVANGYLYVMGGLNGGRTNTVYYAKLNADGSTGAWQTEGDTIPATIARHQSVVANGYVYIIGGDNGAAVTTVYYAKLNADGSTGAWSTNTNVLPVGRRDHGLVAVNGYVYVIGGNGAGATQSTIYYAKINADGSIGAWSTSANSMPAAREYHDSIIANGYLYALGGTNGSTPQSSVYYASLSRLKVGVSLDLVGLTSANNAEGGAAFGGSIYAGNGDFLGSLSVREQAAFLGNVTVDKELRVGGSVLLKNATNSAAAFVIQDSSAAEVLSVNTSTQTLVVKNLTMTGTFTVNGHIISGNISGSTTVAIGAAAGGGAGGSANITGNDTAGKVTVVTTDASTTTGILATITFANAYASAPQVVLTAQDSTGAAIQYYIQSTTTAFTIRVGQTPATSTTYTFSYMVIQ